MTMDYVPQTYVDMIPQQVMDYVPQPRTDMLPVERKVVDYYTIEHQIEHVPQVQLIPKVDYVPVETVEQYVDYYPTRRSFVRPEVQSQVTEHVQPVMAPMAYGTVAPQASYLGLGYGGYGYSGLGYGGLGYGGYGMGYPNGLGIRSVAPNGLPPTTFGPGLPPYNRTLPPNLGNLATKPMDSKPLDAK